MACRAKGLSLPSRTTEHGSTIVTARSHCHVLARSQALNTFSTAKAAITSLREAFRQVSLTLQPACLLLPYLPTYPPVTHGLPVSGFRVVPDSGVFRISSVSGLVV